VGAILRVMNHLCFVNSKVLFRQLRHHHKGKKPVLVQINYHSDVLRRMDATVSHFLDGNSKAFKELPLADTSHEKADELPLTCDEAERKAQSAQAAAELHAQLQEQSPYAWAGVGDMFFKPNGELITPWARGTWGAHAGDPARAVYADFVGARHNVKFMPSGLGVSTRCGDGNVVLVRSIKQAKAATS